MILDEVHPDEMRRVQDSAYAEAAEVLTPDQLSAVSWIAIAINSFNRISIVSRHPVRPR